MNKKRCWFLCDYYFCVPSASLENYFEQPLIQFFPSSTFINCLYSIIVSVMASGTAFIFRRVLTDGPEARLIYCWNRLFNLVVRFIVVKAASVLSICQA